MGLTIHYELAVASASVREARQLVNGLREMALALPFAGVGEVLEFRGDACRYSGGEADDPHAWLKTQAMWFSMNPQGDGYSVRRVEPRHIIAFSILPGPGSEQANFGLCRYPRASMKNAPGESPPHWRWRSFCKTQYASDPAAGGVANFLRCHVGLVRLLDGAKELRILREVGDEAKYWENRDLPGLIQTLGQWNRMLAGMYGQIREALESVGVDPRSLVAPIAEFRDFEHLEAEGQQEQEDRDKP